MGFAPGAVAVSLNGLGFWGTRVWAFAFLASSLGMRARGLNSHSFAGVAALSQKCKATHPLLEPPSPALTP